MTTRSAGRWGPPPADPMAEGPPADPEEVARRILLDQLTGRARSRSELAAKLAGKGVPPDVAERMLTRFAEVGLVDDAAFAAEWVRTRQAGRGLARRALAAELRGKGVPEAVAAEALAAVDPEDEEAAARDLVRRRLGRLGRPVSRADTGVQARRLAGLLARRGYPPELAFRVVREELAVPEEDGTDGTGGAVAW